LNNLREKIGLKIKQKCKYRWHVVCINIAMF
jgi:hypothetical protein